MKMAYMHINQLYKDQRILLFKECFALEKVHGTSAHVAWLGADLEDQAEGGGMIRFFSGGEKHVNFCALFDEEKLRAVFAERFGSRSVTFYGEAYGGKQQGMSATYGKELKFVVFDVMIDGQFVDVPVADEIATACGFEFVPWARVPTDVATLDKYRDMPSEQARRNGCIGPDRFGFSPPIREGVVLRPINECAFNNGARVICKHKRPEFSERASNPPVDPAAQQVLDDAKAVAAEWVVPNRLDHVLDKLGNPNDMSDTGKVIEAMVDDVMREAAGEIADTKAVRKAIGAEAARLFKRRVTAVV
jgi:hypothetical protein